MRDIIKNYYKRETVCNEISDFLKDRWTAVYLDPLWLRWKERDKPLRITNCRDVVDLVENIGARSFYGTLEKFYRLDSRSDVMDDYPINIKSATMYIDIDIIDEGKLDEALPYVKNILKELVNWLHNMNIKDSVYILWSGAGAHLRIHEEAIGPIDDVDPLVASYVLAEYIIRSNMKKLEEILKKSKGLIKIENNIARNRVFTVPLSLHRRLYRSAVTFKPEELEEFNLSWTIPGREKHDKQAWRSYSEGEALDLVRKALEKLGPNPSRTILPLTRRTHKAGEPLAERRIGRFPVMALLQAARYYLLNGDLNKAKSFGLNRAIFYAWAKYYGPARSATRRLQGKRSVPGTTIRGEAKLKPVPGMEEQAPMSSDGWFVMGNVEQRPEDFDRNVARKFEAVGIPFQLAWRAALEYVGKFPLTILRDPQRFYKIVYEPVRDSFIEEVIEARPKKLYYYRRNHEKDEKKSVRRKGSSLLDWM